jgi:hypothetical protein
VNAHAENCHSLDRCEKFATAELRVLVCIEHLDHFFYFTISVGPKEGLMGKAAKNGFNPKVFLAKRSPRRPRFALRGTALRIARAAVRTTTRHRNHLSWRDLDVNQITSSTLLAVIPTNATPKQRMPLVVGFNFPPDMGRMFGR